MPHWPPRNTGNCHLLPNVPSALLQLPNHPQKQNPCLHQVQLLCMRTFSRQSTHCMRESALVDVTNISPNLLVLRDPYGQTLDPQCLVVWLNLTIPQIYGLMPWFNARRTGNNVRRADPKRARFQVSMISQLVGKDVQHRRVACGYIFPVCYCFPENPESWPLMLWYLDENLGLIHCSSGV
jgi:hypothetical protein